MTQFATANVPSGYTATDTSDSANATYGGSYYVTIAKAATSKISFSYPDSSSSTLNTLSASDFASGYPALTDATQTSTLTGTDGTAFDTSKLASAFAGNATSGTTKGYYGVSSSTGKVYFYSYDATATANANYGAKYGDTIKVVFNRTEITAPTSTPTASGNTNYVG